MSSIIHQNFIINSKLIIYISAVSAGLRRRIPLVYRDKHLPLILHFICKICSELPEGIVYMVGNDGTYLKLNVKSDGSFVQEVQPHVEYIFLGTCKGYLNHKEELSVKQAEESEEYTLQFALPSISSPVLIENIFYDFDKATLREESTEALDKLVEMLNENPNITIAEMCKAIGLSDKGVRNNLNKLKQQGVLQRIGPVNGGYWKVLD